MNAPDSETAVRAAIHHWSRLTDLVEFAIRRHGFGDTDSGFGVTYLATSMNTTGKWTAAKSLRVACRCTGSGGHPMGTR
jgi:hypothetical protein